MDNPSEFCGSLSALTVPNGAFVISTINRSIRAFATMIVALEYIFHWVSSCPFCIFLLPPSDGYVVHCVTEKCHLFIAILLESLIV